LIVPIGAIDSEAAETVAVAVASRPTEIHLIIDSVGGNVDASISIYHRLKHFTGPVSAHVVRRCFSAGITVLCAANQRTASPHARFLLHETSHEFSGRMTASEIAKRLPDLRETDERIREIIGRATGCDPAWLAKEEGNEDELSAVEALHRGLIHEVGYDRQSN
jgi:ATP-dependent protease ClpP protease subunit